MQINNRSPHQWGFSDSTFIINPDGSVSMTGIRYNLCGKKMSHLIPFAEQTLGVPIDYHTLLPRQNHKKVSPPNINEPFLNEVKKTFNSSQYSLEDSVRLENSHGQTSVDEIFKVLYQDFKNKVVDLVFYCEKNEDVIKLLALATQHNVCVIPIGGATNVSNALKIPDYEHRMIVALNMRRMNKIEWVDTKNRRVCVQAGITGLELEAELNALGFTSGHEPDSVELSTLGGWISTKCSGMKKNKYGNIEDIVENLCLITPFGELTEHSSFPRESNGMKLNHLIMGSEGNLGVITKAVLKIHAVPPVKEYASIIFPNFEVGLRFLKELSTYQMLPASIRLMDNLQFKFGQALKPEISSYQKIIQSLQKFFLFKIKGLNPNQMVTATVLMEGNRFEVRQQVQLIRQLSKKHQGVLGGAENGKRGYQLTFAIAYIRDLFSQLHILGETFETTVPWDQVLNVYQAVLQEADLQHQKYHLPGKPLICARVTQVYQTGVCVYFTYAFHFKGVDRPDVIFSNIEHAFRKTIIQHGGSISHHHGVGKHRKDFVVNFLSKHTLQALKSIKNTLDPDNIFGIHNNVFYDAGVKSG